MSDLRKSICVRCEINVTLTTVNRFTRELLNHCSSARPNATRTFLVCATVDYHQHSCQQYNNPLTMFDTINFKKTRKALSRAYTSTNAHQSPLIQSAPIRNQTRIIPQNVTVTRGITCSPPKPNSKSHPNVTWTRLPPNFNRIFLGTCAAFPLNFVKTGWVVFAYNLTHKHQQNHWHNAAVQYCKWRCTFTFDLISTI